MVAGIVHPRDDLYRSMLFHSGTQSAPAVMRAFLHRSKVAVLGLGATPGDVADLTKITPPRGRLDSAAGAGQSQIRLRAGMV